MGHAVPVAVRIWRAILRVTLFLLIWSAALAVANQAVHLALEHQQLSRDVQALEMEYETSLDSYAGQLVENERIKSDEERQVELLKKRFGYTEPDETPIIILKGY
jgi:hypothetical protein